jgi:hypothetical protein
MAKAAPAIRLNDDLRVSFIFYSPGLALAAVFRLHFQRLQLTIDEGPYFLAPLQRFGRQLIAHD